MRKALGSLAICMLAGCYPIMHRSIVVEGVVTDFENSPVVNARILLDDYFEITTNEQGYFCLEDSLSPPDIALKAESLGFKALNHILEYEHTSVKITLEKIESNQNSEVRVEVFGNYIESYCKNRELTGVN